MITDTESKITAIDAYVEEIDRRTAQILVEARIYDVSNTDALDLGIEWRVGRNTGYGTGRATGIGTLSTVGGPVADGPLVNSDPFMTGGFTSTTGKATGTTGTLDFGILTKHADIDMLMSAARQKNAAKLLANPRILVLDNEQAIFKAIREIPYQQLQQGGFQSYGTTEFKEVGVELQVTPHLAKDGLIRLRIVPTFSVHVDDVDLFLTGTTNITMPQPVVDSRKADTIALVRDGDTVVIGGLRKEEVTQEISKIPLLADIPILGALFKFQGEQTINSELIVFITPRLADDLVLTEIEAGHLKQTELPTPEPPVTRIDPATREFRQE
jgi:type IV pilus assembly protein PilQ